ncbi:MAG TPA: hypothetical protein PKA07_16635 [Micropruina sp.]|nr:hypothetical protein [Micropruina sp.]
MTTMNDAQPIDEYTIASLAERPELAADVPGLLASRWPAYMLIGRPGHEVDLDALVPTFAENQLLLISADDVLAGAALTLPLPWDGTLGDLPAGWDDAVTRAAASLEHGVPTTAICALSITIAPHATGRGLAAGMIRAMRRMTGDCGFGSLIVPLRPSRKAEYPLIPMERYLAWRTPAGEDFDPWVRLHRRLGGELLGICPRSMTVTGSLEEWRDWLQQEIPGSGDYILPGGLAPLTADADADLGVYVEPNVWFRHDPEG